MISRVADHCFWFGRYVERAESTARVLAVTNYLALDAGLEARQCWHPVVIVSGEERPFAARFGEGAAADADAVQRYLTWDEENPTCIARSVRAARDNARSIREVLSREAWEAANGHYHWIRGLEAQELYAHDRQTFYRHVREAMQLVLGLVRSTMLHDTGMDFIWLGVMLERLNQTARILDVHHHAVSQASSGPHQVVETALWLALLRACSGFEPFMKRHRGGVTAQAVAAFLLLEPRFPRSIRYCAMSAYDRLCAIRPPHEHDLPGRRSLERIKVLNTWLSVRTQDSVTRDGLHEALTHVVDETHAVCEELGRELLGYAPAPAAPGQAQAQG